MPKRRNIKIALERVTRTDLICISCGNFRTEWAVVPSKKQEFTGQKVPDDEPVACSAGGVESAVAGVHTGCIDALHVRFTRKKSPP